MSNTKPEQLRFPSVAGLTVRAEFDGGALSSDFGALLLAGVDRQIGLIDRLTGAVRDRRHPSYVTHSLRDLFAQRIFQVACGFEDGNDADPLRHDPMFKLSVGRKPLDADQALASQSTFSRLENACSRTDAYRVGVAFVDQFIASYAEPPPIVVIDLDHTVDPTHGQQELTFYHAHYDNHCYLPLTIFEGLSGRLITAVLRPGKTPTGRENAMLIKRLLVHLRKAWPDTHIIVRGDGHFANPESMNLIEALPGVDYIFGLPGNAVLQRLAAPVLCAVRRRHRQFCEQAKRTQQEPPQSTRRYEEFTYQAGSWTQPRRVILKAEVMTLGENPRFVVTSLAQPAPQTVYEELYCARGNDENYIKALKRDLKCDRTSDSDFLANQMRLFFACGAYVLHHALRTETLRGTELAQAQPATIMNKLFKIAVKVVQYKDRVRLHLPTTCTVKHLLKKVTELLYVVPVPSSTA